MFAVPDALTAIDLLNVLLPLRLGNAMMNFFTLRRSINA